MWLLLLFVCCYVTLDFYMPDVGIEPTATGLRVQRSTDWASQAYYVLVLYYSDSWFRSRDLWVMGPTRCLCAKSLLKVSPGFEPGFQDSKSWVITPTLWDHSLPLHLTLLQTTWDWKRALPLSYPTFVGGGFEPPTTCLKGNQIVAVCSLNNACYDLR